MSWWKSRSPRVEWDGPQKAHLAVYRSGSTAKTRPCRSVPRQKEHGGETRHRDPSAREVRETARPRSRTRPAGEFPSPRRSSSRSRRPASPIQIRQLRVRRRRRQLHEQRADDRSGAQEDQTISANRSSTGMRLPMNTPAFGGDSPPHRTSDRSGKRSRTM